MLREGEGENEKKNYEMFRIAAEYNSHNLLFLLFIHL